MPSSSSSSPHLRRAMPGRHCPCVSHSQSTACVFQFFPVFPHLLSIALSSSPRPPNRQLPGESQSSGAPASRSRGTWPQWRLGEVSDVQLRTASQRISSNIGASLVETGDARTGSAPTIFPATTARTPRGEMNSGAYSGTGVSRRKRTPRNQSRPRTTKRRLLAASSVGPHRLGTRRTKQVGACQALHGTARPGHAAPDGR